MQVYAVFLFASVVVVLVETPATHATIIRVGTIAVFKHTETGVLVRVRRFRAAFDADILIPVANRT